MANVWDKFDKVMDVEGLKTDMKESAENGGNYKEVPLGDYEVKVEKLELGETKKGDPALKAWFKILTGDYKGSMIFMTQVLKSGFGLHKANEFLRSLETEYVIDFESFHQYGELIMDVAEYIDDHNLEYALKYGENKGFNTFEITEVFEAE